MNWGVRPWEDWKEGGQLTDGRGLREAWERKRAVGGWLGTRGHISNGETNLRMTENSARD